MAFSDITILVLSKNKRKLSHILQPPSEMAEELKMEESPRAPGTKRKDSSDIGYDKAPKKIKV